MKNLTLIFFCFSAIFIGSVYLSTPNAVAAETGIAQLAGCTGVDCSACNIVHLANGGIKWLIGILFIIFALLLAIAGVKLVTSGGNHHALDEAKSSFTNAIIGFIIILSAWLIVDTIMRALVGTDSNPGQLSDGTASGYLFWSDIQCQEYIKPIKKDVVEEEVVWIDPIEFAIDQGSGNAGSITIETPAGTQAVDVRPCDTSSMVTVNFLGGRATVNKQFAASLQRIDAAWQRQGASRYRVTSVGSYNCRNIAGTNRKSNHAYGVAIDINPTPNPHCPHAAKCGGKNILITDMPPSFRQLFLNEGWGWGGNWRSSKDAMHFSKATSEGGNMRGN